MTALLPVISKWKCSQDGKGLEVKPSDQLKKHDFFETREADGRKSTLNSKQLELSVKKMEKGILCNLRKGKQWR